MKKNIFVICSFVLISSFIFSSCNSSSKSEQYLEKNQEIVLTGRITKSGSGYILTTSSGKIQELESYTIEFANYINQTKTVTGEFSGNTLFVTQVE